MREGEGGREGERETEIDRVHRVFMIRGIWCIKVSANEKRRCILKKDVTYVTSFFLGCEIANRINDIETAIHWNENVVILTKFLSLAALEVVILTTSSVASDENFTKMKTFSFQCCRQRPHDIDGLMQDCSNSSALAVELLQFCGKPSIWYQGKKTPRVVFKNIYFKSSLVHYITWFNVVWNTERIIWYMIQIK